LLAGSGGLLRVVLALVVLRRLVDGGEGAVLVLDQLGSERFALVHVRPPLHDEVGVSVRGAIDVRDLLGDDVEELMDAVLAPSFVDVDLAHREHGSWLQKQKAPRCRSLRQLGARIVSTTLWRPAASCQSLMCWAVRRLPSSRAGGSRFRPSI